MARLKTLFENLFSKLENRETQNSESIFIYDYFADPEISIWADEEVRSFSKRLKIYDALVWEEYDQHWNDIFLNGRELIIGQDEYGLQHKRRFWELLNNLAMVLNSISDKKEILEFGASEFSALYKRLFTDITLDVADRPVSEDYIGFTPKVISRISKSRNCFSTNLENPKELSKLKHTVPDGYDAIVFAEVLEHLIVNPKEIFREMLHLLKDNGILLLTTPNFFSAKNIKKIIERENPHEVYPGKSANWDAHYHCREYGLKEICKFVHAAGGVVKGFCFSHCCDDLNFLKKENIVGEAGTITVAAGKR